VPYFETFVVRFKKLTTKGSKVAALDTVGKMESIGINQFLPNGNEIKINKEIQNEFKRARFKSI